jgi:hypothetical protein
MLRAVSTFDDDSALNTRADQEAHDQRQDGQHDRDPSSVIATRPRAVTCWAPALPPGE